MNDERRESDRRDEDMRLAAAMEGFDPADFATACHSHESLDQLVELVVGTDGDVLGGEKPKLGMAPKVDEMYQAFRNGGLAIRLPGWSKLLGFVLVVMQIVLTVVLIAQATQAPT